MTKLILTKTSTENEIRAYFTKVLELTKSGEEFTVDLEEVWPLAYTEKGNAVRVLKRDFIENVDFILLGRNDKQTRGGHNEVYYKITAACMEHLIARKVAPVFEVYRKVFHQSLEPKKFDIQDILGNVEVTIAMLKEYQKEKVKSIELEQKLEYALPKAEMAERAIELGGLVDVGEAAKLLGLQLGGRNNLYQALREDGYFFLNKNKNEPLQKWIKKGWFELKEKGNKEGMKPGSYVTQQGLFELSRLYDGKKDLSYMRPNNTKDRDISKFQLSIKFEY